MVHRSDAGPTIYDQFKSLDLEQLLREISKASTGSTPGKDRIHLLQNFVLVRNADMVNRQLAETASSIGRSAGLIDKAFRMRLTRHPWNAQETRNLVASLTENLAKASTGLETAGAQSARLSRRLIWLTGVLAATGVLTALATIFYAVETKRLVDRTERQLRQNQSVQAPSADTTKSPPGKRQ